MDSYRSAELSRITGLYPTHLEQSKIEIFFSSQWQYHRSYWHGMQMKVNCVNKKSENDWFQLQMKRFSSLWKHHLKFNWIESLMAMSYSEISVFYHQFSFCPRINKFRCNICLYEYWISNQIRWIIDVKHNKWLWFYS